MNRPPEPHNGLLALAIVSVFCVMLVAFAGVLKSRHKLPRPKVVLYHDCYTWTDGEQTCRSPVAWRVP